MTEQRMHTGRVSRMMMALALLMVAVTAGVHIASNAKTAHAVACGASSTLWAHGPNWIGTYDVRTGTETILSTDAQTLYDLAVAVNGDVWAVRADYLTPLAASSGFVQQFDPTTNTLGAQIPVTGMDRTPMASFDKYGYLYSIGLYDPADPANAELSPDSKTANVLVRYDPTAGSPAVELVPVAAGVTSYNVFDGFAAGSTDLSEVTPAGDVFFLGGDMYVLVTAGGGALPRTKLVRLDMTDSGTEYVWSGTVVDLGYVGPPGLPGFGMGVVDGQVYVHDVVDGVDVISRLDTIPSTGDFTRTIGVTRNVITPTDGRNIYGLAGATEASVDMCAGAPSLRDNALSVLKVATETSFFLDATGYPASTFAVTAGALPDGMALDTATGRIYGTPTTAGPYDVTITMTDILANTAVKQFTGVVGDTPDAPTGVSGETGDGSVTVSWTAGDTQYGTISSYTVTAAPGGATCTTASTSCVVSGLSNGTSYTFTVTATTEFGSSAASVASESVAPVGAPNAPTGVTGVLSGVDAVDVSWSAPVDDGGSAITSYTATASPGGATCSTASNACTITGLDVDRVYTFTVTAANAAGTSDSSAASANVYTAAPMRAADDTVVVPTIPDAAVVWSNGTTSAASITVDATSASVDAAGAQVSVALGSDPTMTDGVLSVKNGALTITGIGLAAAAQYEVWLLSSPVLLAHGVTDGAGSFSSPVTLPLDVASGAHTLQVEGTAADNTEFAAVFNMTVPAPPAPTTTTPAPTTTTPAPTTTPSTTVPPAVQPVPTDNGSLPALAAGEHQAYVDGTMVDVTVSAATSDQLVMAGTDFTVALTPQCGSNTSCTVVPNPTGSASITLTSNATVAVVGSGYRPGSVVHMWMFSTPTYLGAATVDVNGSFTAAVQLPRIPAGSHTMQINGTSMQGTERTANFGVTVSSALSGALPDTGNGSTPAVVGVALLLAGAALLTATRRRSRS